MQAVIPSVKKKKKLKKNPQKSPNYQLFNPMMSKSMVSQRRELRGANKLLSVFSPSASAAHPSLSSVFHSKSFACLQMNSTHRVSCHLTLPRLSPSSPSIETCKSSLFLCAFISYLSCLLSLPEHISSFTLFLFLVTSVFHIYHYLCFIDVDEVQEWQILSKDKRKESHTICWLLRIHCGRRHVMLEHCDAMC